MTNTRRSGRSPGQEPPLRTSPAAVRGPARRHQRPCRRLRLPLISERTTVAGAAAGESPSVVRSAGRPSRSRTRRRSPCRPPGSRRRCGRPRPSKGGPLELKPRRWTSSRAFVDRLHVVPGTGSGPYLASSTGFGRRLPPPRPASSASQPHLTRNRRGTPPPCTWS